MLGDRHKATLARETFHATRKFVYLGCVTALERWVILPDIHVPFHDFDAVDVALQVIERFAWNGVLQIGDFADLACVSKFNGYDATALQELPTLLEEYRAAHQLWTRIIAAGCNNNPDCKFEWMQGNHEYRINRFISGMPQLAEICSIEYNFRDLFEQGLKWIPNWDGPGKGVPRKFGNDLLVMHGRRHSKYHARWMADDYCPYTVLYGHVHDISSFSKQSFVGPGDYQISSAQSIGHLADPRQHYVGHHPTNWQHGFATIGVLPNGSTFHEVHEIKAGRCVFNGELIESRVKNDRKARSAFSRSRLYSRDQLSRDASGQDRQQDPEDSARTLSDLAPSFDRFRAWGWE